MKIITLHTIVGTIALTRICFVDGGWVRQFSMLESKVAGQTDQVNLRIQLEN